MAMRAAFLMAFAPACAPESEPPADAADAVDAADSAAAVDPTPLDPVRLLARRSLDLRGIRPTPAEIRAVEADASQLDVLTESYTLDPAFPSRMAWLWNDAIHTAVWGPSLGLFGELEFPQWHAMGQEPLRVIQVVIDEDRPFTDIVTTSQGQVNDTLGALYDVPGGGADWHWADYPDGRPTAGILSTRAFWMRYMADAVNFNRTRANAVARIFLCADFLEREGGVSFDIDASSLAKVERAVAEEPACLTCHAALDPLASFMGGFAERSDEVPLDQFTRWSTFEADWYTARQAPAWFGIPARDLGDMGVMLAADPRFESCTARRFAAGMLGRRVDDLQEVAELAALFAGNGHVVRPYVVQLVSRPDIMAAEARVLTTEQLGSALVAFLGWGEGVLDTDGLMPLTWSPEHRVLGGGTDDDTVLLRAKSLGVGPAVLLEWTARAAALPALEADLARSPDDRVLYTVSGADASAPDEAAVRAQLTTWLLGAATLDVDPDGPEIDGLLALYASQATPLEGYTLALQAVIRHPAVLVH